MEGRWPPARTATGIAGGKAGGKQEGRQEGLQKGRLEGERVLLQKQLERRFGALPPWVSERLAQATPEQLEAWGLDLLDAADLGDLFQTG
jgi:hypothetical protein